MGQARCLGPKVSSLRLIAVRLPFVASLRRRRYGHVRFAAGMSRLAVTCPAGFCRRKATSPAGFRRRKASPPRVHGRIRR
eukprot:11179701-Lingulodinium_polyedra.AAC.1